MMADNCAIINLQVNENAARMNAFLVALAVTAFLLFRDMWIVLILAVDFFIRGFLKPSYSPLAMLSKAILKTIHARNKMVNAAPKMFAAKIGFILCIAIMTFGLSGVHSAALITGMVIIFFAALESLWGYCVGCKMHTILYKTFIFRDYGSGI